MIPYRCPGPCQNGKSSFWFDTFNYTSDECWLSRSWKPTKILNFLFISSQHNPNITIILQTKHKRWILSKTSNTCSRRRQNVKTTGDFSSQHDTTITTPEPPKLRPSSWRRTWYLTSRSDHSDNESERDATFQLLQHISKSTSKYLTTFVFSLPCPGTGNIVL